MKSINFFLPQVNVSQLEAQGEFHEHLAELEIKPLTKDWETLFCERVGYAQSTLPWTRLRQQQFELSNHVEFACCCDPVVVQMTHRGAYMIGQHPLKLSPNDGIRIVTKINETLMQEGEQIYLIDQFSWLYVSNQSKSLESKNIGDLIGKDLYEFSYNGKDADYFQKLNTEIQMLIKQMADYGELESPSPEMLLNVHFFDPQPKSDEEDLPFIKNENVLVYADNELIKAFCMHTFLAQQPLNFENEQLQPEQLVLAFDVEKEKYAEVIGYWLHLNLNNPKIFPTLYCQDAQISFVQQKNWFKRLLTNRFSN